jgi:hypothetical protein
MLICKSPRKVMRAAHVLALRCLRAYWPKFSRHGYTLPQLFACLVVREPMRLSYRPAEAPLRDGRAWCRAIGIKGNTPGHATPHRGAGVLLAGRRLGTRRTSGRKVHAGACSARRWRSIRRCTTRTSPTSAPADGSRISTFRLTTKLPGVLWVA